MTLEETIRQIVREEIKKAFPESKPSLRDLRIAAKLTQQELADKAGVDKKTVCWTETGRVHPQRKSLEKIARCLGVKCGEFRIGA